ncbi:hypothetical protein [Tsukamurella sp. 1534]|uniref:hypothetical protein n=1 Tax=Tsukamurella sp. 1534 TaxID=1151061 RepID=UPI00031F3E5A|nr:hypothetical protein [Tsukamurella sp. 1534]
MTGKRELSIGRLALFALGAAVLVLGAAALLVNVLRPGPAVGLLIVAVGLVGAVAAMGVVSKRMVAKATRGEDERNADDATH